MQFVLIAYDGTDKKAQERRMKVRPSHLERVAVLKKEGKIHFGGAILDDEEQMIGSVVVYDFPGWEEIEDYLKTDPYVTEGVWEKIEIKPFRLAKV